jgi:hypothetical protein
VILIVALSSSGAGQVKQEKVADCDSVSVPVIKDIHIKYDGMKSIEITVTGTVPTGGYKDHSLVRRAYLVAPADGIWEYDMLTCKPSGIVAQVITSVTAKDKWEDPPQSLKGIRVHGDKESKEVPVKWP